MDYSNDYSGNNFDDYAFAYSLAAEGLDETIVAELEKIDKSLLEAKAIPAKLVQRSLSFEFEQPKGKVSLERKLDAFVRQKRNFDKRQTENKKKRRKLAKSKNLNSWNNFVSLAMRTWNKHCSTKMIMFMNKPTPHDLKLLGDIWRDSDKDARRAVQIVYHGILGLKREWFYEQNNNITFASAASNSKLLRYSKSYEVSHSVTISGEIAKHFDGASSGDSLIKDDDIAIYQGEMLCKIINNYGKTALIQVTKDFTDVVMVKDLEPCTDVTWYQDADPVVFSETKGYKEFHSKG